MGTPPEQAIAPMWEAFLAQMTEQGATRAEIAQMALGTALTVLGATAQALWQGGSVPQGEVEVAVHFGTATDALRTAAEEVAAL